MSRLTRRVVQAALGAALLAAVAALLLVLLLDPGTHKGRIEEAASRALGMQVSVSGPIALRWRPGAYLVLNDVRARKHDADIAAMKQAVLGVDLMSLFDGQPRVHSVALHDGTLDLVRDADGRFNVQKDRVPGEPRPARDLPDVSFDRAAIRYADARLERRIEARDCRGEIRALRTAGGERRWLAGLSFDGEAACAEVRSGDVVLTDARTEARVKEGVYDFQPASARMFDAPAAGRLHADFTGPVAAYQIEQTLQQVSTEALLKALSLKPLVSGRIDAEVKMVLHGGPSKGLRQSMKGTVSLRGRGLVYHGSNIDEQFDRFESSQTLNLFDVGAMLLAGPAGLLVTKGYDFVAVAQGAQGKSEIRSLRSDWTVDRGVARAHDVALATAGHRLAIKGDIDIVGERFQDMTVALVDTKGCAKVQQQVRGPLHKPVIDKPNPIEALAGPAVRLLKKGAELVGADSCDAFYTGSVAPPEAKSK